MELLDTHINVEHVEGRWLKSLERYADARKRYPELSDKEFESFARESRSLITVGRQADLYIDTICFESMYQHDLAQRIEAEQLPEFTLFVGHTQVRKLQESIRWMRAMIHRELSRLAWNDHGIEMQNTHFGTRNQLNEFTRREVIESIERYRREIAESEVELKSLVERYSQEGATEIAPAKKSKSRSTTTKRRSKN